MKHRNQDPSFRTGNKLKNGARALTAVAALSLAACTTPSNQEASPAATKAPATAPAKAPETTTSGIIKTEKLPTTTSTSPEQLQETKEKFNQRSSQAAQELAARVINSYNTAPASVEHWLYEPKDDPKHGVAVNYLPTAGTLLGGEYGEYVIAANVSRDAQGNLDPTTVTDVFVGMNVNVAGKHTAQKPEDRDNIYNFNLHKYPDGDWQWSGAYDTKGGDQNTFDFESGKGSVHNMPGRFEGPDTLYPLMAYLTSDAHRVMNWAETNTPVNLVLDPSPNEK